MNTFSASSLSDGMHAFVRTALRFAPAGGDWPSRRAAFARQCAHFTPPRSGTITVSDQLAGGVTTRCIRPAEPAPARGWPVLLYFHGGGWTAGDHTTHDWFAAALLQRVKVAVLAVDYRLAPEASFPAPLLDGRAVWDAIADLPLPLDPTRRAVAGDSAGATLAAALCIALRAAGKRQPRAQVLAYPVLSASTDFPSMIEHAHAPILSASGLASSIDAYLPNPDDRRNPLAMPLEVDDCTALAPALLALAQVDPARDQGLAYAARLRDAGVPVDVCAGAGLVHGCLRAAQLPEVGALYDRIAAFLLEKGVAFAS
ncbi:alpha/beta hydrolase [Burkholderia sp. MR1-5-21]